MNERSFEPISDADLARLCELALIDLAGLVGADPAGNVWEIAQASPQRRAGSEGSGVAQGRAVLL